MRALHQIAESIAQDRLELIAHIEKHHPTPKPELGKPSPGGGPVGDELWDVAENLRSAAIALSLAYDTWDE